MPEPTNADFVDAIDDVLTSTLALVRGLREEDADLPTACPGWTVRDQLAHMVGLEQVLAGAPEPTLELPPFDHVASDLDVYMEKPVHARRALPLSAIADELAGLQPRRIDDLRRLASQDGDPLVKGPVSDRALSAALPVRVFDLWAHEQDIRQALGLSIRTDCAASDIALARSLKGWSAALPEKLAGVDAEMVIRVTEPDPFETTIVIGAGGPMARLTGSAGELTRVFCGRIEADAMLDGDPAVTSALADALALTP